MHIESDSGAALEPLPVRRRKLSSHNFGQYRVISKSGERYEIVANTAYEAFKISGLKEAIKIERAFNLWQMIFPASQLTEDIAAQSETESADNLGLVLRLHPVVSADELHTMMQATMSMKDNAEAENSVPVTEGHSPVPLSEQSLTPSSDLAGTHVEGDGFDELIPASMPEKPSANVSIKAQPSAEENHFPLPPEQELSSEEIDKLLDGK